MGNKEKDGNIIFMIDEQQIPHRIIFRNREEYDILEWFIQRTTKTNLNVIKIDWTQYIRNIKKLRGDQIQEKRKMIKSKGQQQMQIEQLDQSQIEFIPKIKPEFKNIQQSINEQQDVNILNTNQQQQQKKPLQLKLKNQTQVVEDIQILQELTLQKKLETQQYIDEQMISDLQQILSFDLEQGKDVQTYIIDKINNEDYIKILPQFPKEANPQKLIKLSRGKNLQTELNKGQLYLNQEYLTNLDAQIGQYLQDIQYTERQIQIQNKFYTLSSPVYVLDVPHPLLITRQWWYYKDKDHVKFYIIHSQLLWYLYNQFQIKSQESFSLLNQVIASQMQDYLNRWTGLIIDDEQENWFEASESSLVKAAESNIIEQIRQNVDNLESNYALQIKENMWFTNFQVCCIYYEHRIYGIKKTLVTYIRLQGLCYFTNLKTEEIIQQMFKYGISLQNSPSFEVVQSHEIICWLCGRVSQTWESFYVHECQQSQKLMNLRENLQSWNL